MVVSRNQDGLVRFAIRPRRMASDVRLAGDFSGWRPISMRRQRGNRFVAAVHLPAGMYEYKFIIDGHWQPDPSNECRTVNPYGTVHSLLEVN